MLAQCVMWIAFLALGSAGIGMGMPPTCDSPIYCNGRLLHTIQMAELYKDSKTFVDKKLKYSQNETLDNFEKMMADHEQKPSFRQIERFVMDHFEDAHELEVTEPKDWIESPPVLDRIPDRELKEWASQLNRLWLNFTRKISDEVLKDNSRYSLIYVPNRFVVPGGRFREFYYWDTYWIIRGLMVCGMKETSRGMLENFVQMVRKLGHVPNGGRIYYVQRSQPPLLIPMVESYYQETFDLQFIQDNIKELEQEFQFWFQNRTVTVEKNGMFYTLARYYAVSKGPRPESYKEDYNKAHETFDQEDRQQEFYEDIKSAAESGWDFSSRWFIANGTNNGNLSDIHTRHIIPVDLNAYLCMNARILARFFSELGESEKAQEYTRLAREWREAVTSVLWDAEEGSWFDYDNLNNKPRKYFYGSNFVPLWAGCYHQGDVGTIAQKVVGYLMKHKVKEYPGGVPTSDFYSSEQWDLPNAWPPLQSILIMGLIRTKQQNATNLAFDLAHKWVLSNYKGYKDTGEMFEKYNSYHPGATGYYGEYEPQSGFGWTNGVILELLSYYGGKLKIKSRQSAEIPSRMARALGRPRCCT